MDINQYLGIFLEEGKEHLQSLTNNLLSLEKDPTNTVIIGEIFRSAHTLKGMAATMGFEEMATLTHEMENILDKIRNNHLSVSTEILDALFKSLDQLENIIDSINNGGNGKIDISVQLNLLKNILEGKKIEETVKRESDNGKLNDLNFNQYELTVLKQSFQNNFKLFKITVYLKQNSLLKSARAYMVFKKLEEYGEIFKTIPTVEEIEEEKFDLKFTIYLINKSSITNIENEVMNISDIEKVEIYEISLNDLNLELENVNYDDNDIDDPKNTKERNSTNNISNEKNLVVDGKQKIVSNKTIRVDTNRLDDLMNLFSELVIDRGRLEQINKDTNNIELNETIEHMSRIIGSLQNIILNLRMVPVEQVFNRFPRMIRDLAKELNKKVDLQIIGAETELDRTVIDEIGDPLVHLLRNAIDHGIENIDERKKSGKNEIGLITLHAYHSGNYVFIEVSDDGHGIDSNKIVKKGIEKNYIMPQQANILSEKQIFDLLFLPGFSTAKNITDISGRGVGLDVVKAKIESLGGSVSIDSILGKGTKFIIQLPLTLSIISAMLVQVGEEKYAVPLSSILETAIYQKSNILNVQQQKVIDFRGKIIPIIYLKDIFSIPNVQDSEEVSIVIVKKRDKIAGIVVDSFIGQQEIVLKSLGGYLTNIFAIAGATILGDGQVALIIDSNSLIK